MGLQKTFLGNGRMKKSIIARPLGGQVWDPSPGLLLQNFEVAEILAKRDNTQGVEYLVSWKGKSADYYTWEPISNVSMLHLVYGSKVSPSPPSLLRSCKKRSASHHEHDDNQYLIKRPKGSESPTASDRLPPGSVAPPDRPLTLQDIINGVTGQRMISVVNGRLADIPKPGPSLPDVLKHPDYSTFMAKLSALPGPPITIRNEFDSTKPSPPLDFEFMEDLKLGEGVPEWDSSASFGCSCGLGGCENNPECECLEKLDMDESHSPFAELSYTKSQRLCPGHCNTKIIYECNPVCDCGPNCGNKVVGRGRQVPLEIFMTPENKGWGLRCPEALHKGTFIGKYLGEVVTHEEATKRAIDGDTRGSSYLFDLDFFTEGHEEDGDEGREVENYSIDGRLCGSYTRFINHSCDPNTDVYVVVSYRRDSIVYDLAMFTNRDLQPWEEITFSYTEGPAPVGPEGKTKTWPCHCGASNCRGELW